MARNRKNPSQRKQPPVGKIPRAGANPETINKEFICWHFGIADLDGPWGWKSVDYETLWNRIYQRIKNFESMTWGEILRDRKRNHYIKPTNVIPEARRRLEELNLDDQTNLLSLTVSGTERVWGVRDRHIFKVLWWDPDHQICPSALKHT